MGEFDADLALFGEYVQDAEAVPYHGKWAASNKNGDAPKWAAFRDALLARQTPTVPSMATKYGRALVTAGRQHMSISHLVGVITNPFPPPDPPPPPGGGRPPLPPTWSGPITITDGGTYEGAWESTTPGSPAVTIATPAPVVLKGWVRNLAGGGGVLINALQTGVRLTVEDLYGYGKLIVPNNENPTRFLWTENHQALTIRRCHMENTAGIEISGADTDGTVLITQNRCKNIQGYVDNGAGILRVGNFVQFRTASYGGGIEVSWNEIINEYNKSWPEDVVSIYHTSNVQCFDNYIQHQSTPGNAFNVSSQNGITIDGSTSGPGAHSNYVARNQLVDGLGIGTHVGFGGSNNLIEANRIVQNGFLPDETTKIGNGHTGLFLVGGQSNNHAHSNSVIYWGRPDSPGGALVRRDFLLTGAPEGAAAEEANNTALPDPANEAAEWTLWQQKLVTNSKIIGP